MIRELKSIFRDVLGLPAWLVLAAAGCAAHIACNVILRKPIDSGWGLIGAAVLGVALESYEIWEQYRNIGLFAPGNDPLLAILGRHATDVLCLLAGSLFIVVVGAFFGTAN